MHIANQAFFEKNHKRIFRSIVLHTDNLFCGIHTRTMKTMEAAKDEILASINNSLVDMTSNSALEGITARQKLPIIEEFIREYKDDVQKLSRAMECRLGEIKQ
ncbi:hypothetical protein HWV62_8215 [Athelia sp. TMB]|nr:hypothetical protein HWV62_45573 [Athelia sp. TMB]KAF7975935.1 hypothetical protein HWV62_8215 [Athelia sp. TMB]